MSKLAEVQLPNGKSFHVTEIQAAKLCDQFDIKPDRDSKHRIRRIKIQPELKIRGLSCKVGEYLERAIRLERKEAAQAQVEPSGWATVFFAHQRMRTESASNCV